MFPIHGTGEYTATATAWVAVWDRDRENRGSCFFKRVDNSTRGFPEGALRTEISLWATPAIPNALYTASLAAKRTAKCWAAFFFSRQ